MNFQVLELQDQMQKMQEENERRFQALENGDRADAGSTPNDGNNTSLASAAPLETPITGFLEALRKTVISVPLLKRRPVIHRAPIPLLLVRAPLNRAALSVGSRRERLAPSGLTTMAM